MVNQKQNLWFLLQSIYIYFLFQNCVLKIEYPFSKTPIFG